MRKILSAVKNSLIAIIKGELLLRLGIEEYFAHILFCFFMMGLTIFFSLLIDNSLHKMEENREKIDDLEMVKSQYRYELATLESRPSVCRSLDAMGSKLKEPTVNVTVIELPSDGRIKNRSKLEVRQ